MPWSLFAESILFASSRTQLVAATQCELGLPIDESLDAVSGGSKEVSHRSRHYSVTKRLKRNDS